MHWAKVRADNSKDESFKSCKSHLFYDLTNTEIFWKHMYFAFSTFGQFSSINIKMSYRTFCRIEVHIQKLVDNYMADHK